MTYLKLNVIFLKNSGRAFTRYSPTGLYNLRCLALEREEMDILIEVDKREGRIPGEASDPPNRKQVFTNDRIVISLFIVDRRILLERGDFHF